MIIALNASEIQNANRVGRERFDRAETWAKDDPLIAPHVQPLDAHIAGALAEAVAVKLTGYEWNEHEDGFWRLPHKDRKADVGPIEVRTAANPMKFPSLIVKKDEDPDRPYLLVVKLNNAEYRLDGWLMGRDVKINEYWRQHWPSPCFAAPNRHLTSLPSLERYCVSLGYPPFQQGEHDETKR